MLTKLSGRVIYLFFFPALSFAQSPVTGNNLFAMLAKPVSASEVRSFNEFYNLVPKDNNNYSQPSQGIEYITKRDSIKTIILHAGNSEWTAYSYDLPIGLKWQMTEDDVIRLLGKQESTLPYHYDINLDLKPIYEEEGSLKKLSEVELKYTDYEMKNTGDIDDDALIALFTAEPKNFKFLKPGIADRSSSKQKELVAGTFDKNRFKDQLNTVIGYFTDRKKKDLKGDLISEIKIGYSTYEHYASTQPISNVKDQYLEQVKTIGNLYYVIILDEIKHADASSFPSDVINKYNNWISILKEMLPSPWKSEDDEVIAGVVDKGITFENKTGQWTSGGFTYNKYPLLDLYIVYKKDHYSIELKITGSY